VSRQALSFCYIWSPGTLKPGVKSATDSHLTFFEHEKHLKKRKLTTGMVSWWTTGHASIFQSPSTKSDLTKIKIALEKKLNENNMMKHHIVI
jgi:hypothetical protein